MTRRPALVVAIGLLAVGAIAAFLLFDGDPRPRGDSGTRESDTRISGADRHAVVENVAPAERKTASAVVATTRPTRPIVGRAFEDVDSRLDATVRVPVLVLDDEGFPVPGAKVAFSDERDSDLWPGPLMLRPTTVFEHASKILITDARGVAVIDEATDGLTIYAGTEKSFGMAEFKTVPRKEVRLRLESSNRPKWGPHPFGRVLLKVLDPEGRPLREPVTASLDSIAIESVPLRSRSADGTIRFRRAAANASTKASATCESFDAISLEPIGSVPENGELVAELRFKRRKAIVVGRAVDESGSPLRHQTLELAIDSSEGSSWLRTSGSVTTDRDGEFRQRVDRSHAKRKPLVLGLASCSAPGVVERAGCAALPPSLEADEVDLGDIRLVPPERLVSGTVVDDTGAPVSGAAVVLMTMVERSIGFEGPRRPFAFGLDRVRVDGGGAFSFVRHPGVAKDDTFGIKAELEGYSCRVPVVVRTPMAEPVRVVLRRLGTIEGSFLLPEGAPVGALWIKVVRTSPVSEIGETASLFDDAVESDGSFRVAGVLPGKALVSIFLADFADLLVEIPNVEVPPLGTTTDARLRAIDLRGHASMRRR